MTPGSRTVARDEWGGVDRCRRVRLVTSEGRPREPDDGPEHERRRHSGDCADQRQGDNGHGQREQQRALEPPSPYEEGVPNPATTARRRWPRQVPSAPAPM